MNRLFLLDAYALIYRSYYAFIKSPRINSKGFNTSAILGFVNTLQEILTRENPTHIGIAFDPKGGTFRHKIYEDYKAQREMTPEVISLSVPVIKDIVKAYNIPVLEIPQYEADDVIGTVAKKAEAMGFETFMLTPDKDYCQLVSESTKLYKPGNAGNGYEILGVNEVLEKYSISNTSQVIDLLGLMGDSADNIPGCEGVGPKTAVRLLNEFGSVENLLENTSKIKGSLREKVETNADKIRLSKFLATIRTDIPLDFEIDSLKRKTPDMQALTQILNALEMNKLLQRIKKDFRCESPADTSGSQHNPAVKKENGNLFYGDLFGIFAGNDTEVSENENLKDVPTPQTSIYIIDNEKDIELFNIFVKDPQNKTFSLNAVSSDLFGSKITGIAITDGGNLTWFFELNRNSVLYDLYISSLRQILENSTTTIIGYDLKNVMSLLAQHDISLLSVLFDVLVAHYVLQPELNHNPENIGGDFNIEIAGFAEKDNPKETATGTGVFSNQEIQGCCRYANLFMTLKDVLEKQLTDDGTLDYFRNIEMPLTKVLSKMERNGVNIDLSVLRENSEVLKKRMYTIQDEIYQAAGFEFNILSPKQLGEVLFDRMHLLEKPKKTKSGQYVTSEEVLEKLSGENPIAGLILKYRGLKKIQGTYVDALPLLINPSTGKIHTTFNQTVAATGRLSSSNPNLQNMPVRDEDGKEVRKSFVPEKGCLFFSADYSQIELRLMAHLSGDSNMINDFARGEDIHLATAAKVFHKDIGQVTRLERAKAKSANFGIIYGISPFGLAEQIKVSRSEAKKLIDDYFETYPGIKRYIENQINDTREKGYAETIMHRKRYLPDITSGNAVVRGFAERNAVNAPIQGSAADIIKCAMVRIDRRFDEEHLKSKMIIQVHDELDFSVAPGEEEIVRRIVTEEMENAYPMSVRLVVDCRFGKNWLEAH